MKFSTLMLAASTASLIAAAPSLKKSKNKRAAGLQWFGSNESGGEFGTALPGAFGTDYTWPDTAAIQTLIDAGMNIFRVPFLMERAIPGSMTGTVNETYFSGYETTINYITTAGAHAIVDPHNYGRYYGNIINSTSDFAAFWTTIATIFADNDLVVFDTNNEYNTMEQTLVVDLNQAAINAIRAAGATTQYIFAEGNSWTGAWTWTTVNPTMVSLTDPSNNLVYEMHQYLDSDGSGTAADCVNNTIGVSRIESATQWLIQNNKTAFLGEFAAGNNSVCSEAVTGMLTYMQQNSDVWLGASWWSAGPWWADYIFSMEPDTGYAYEYYLDILKPYFPGATAPVTSTTAWPTSTTSWPATTSSSWPTSSWPATTSSSWPASSWSTSTTASSTPTGTDPQYSQCGGIGYAGPTACVAPYTCTVLNPYYSQCLL